MNTVAGRGSNEKFLSRMVAEVRREISDGYYEAKPAERLEFALRPPSLVGAICRARRRPAILVELKHASPGYGSGPLRPLAPAEFVQEASRAGADALSVIPQPYEFGGSLAEFGEVVTRTQLPVLFKDFILSPDQIAAAASWGASAVLLLARLELSGQMMVPLSELVEEAHRHGLEALVEIHAEEELPGALRSHPDLLGVNARDLETLELSVERASMLVRSAAWSSVPLIGMSGIEDSSVARSYVEEGADALLVGTPFVQQEDRVAFLDSLRVG